MGLKAYNVICTNDISEDYDVDALGATDFEAYACDNVDEHIGKLEAENRRLKRALYKACANWAMAEAYSVLNDAQTSNRWVHTLNKCRAKAEEYK